MAASSFLGTIAMPLARLDTVLRGHAPARCHHRASGHLVGGVVMFEPSLPHPISARTYHSHATLSHFAGTFSLCKTSPVRRGVFVVEGTLGWVIGIAIASASGWLIFLELERRQKERP